MDSHLKDVIFSADEKTLSFKIKKLFRNFTVREQIDSFVFIFILMLGGFSVIPFISPYMVYNVGLPESHLPLIYFLGGVCALFTSPFFGKLADKFGAQKIFTILAIISLPIVFAMTHLPQVSIFLGLAVTTLFIVFVSGRNVPSMTLISSVPEPKNRGAFLGLVGSVQQMGSGLASLVAGAMISNAPDGKLVGYSNVGWLSIGFTIVAIVLSRRIRSRNPV
jgi:MFS transporter, DHA1 family, inner membrane transport protein